VQGRLPDEAQRRLLDDLVAGLVAPAP